MSLRIAVIGAGGVGGIFGGRLAAAGTDVTFVARGAHGAALRADGLRIRSPAGEEHVPAVKVLAPGEAGGPFDVILIAVKMYDLAAAGVSAAALAGPGTVVVPLQNGIEAPGMLAGVVGQERVAAGVAYIAASIARPGVLEQIGGMGRILFGPAGPDGTRHQRLLLDRLAEACARAGVDGTVATDIQLEIWRKFTFLAPFAGITAAARQPIGPILADAALRQRFAAMIEETVALGRAMGVTLPPDLAADRLDFAGRLPPGMRSSLLHDLEAGRPLEVDWLTGAVVRLSQPLGIPVPVSSATLDAIRRHRA